MAIPATVVDDTAFASGTLRVTSFARPGKLFTSNNDLMTAEGGLHTRSASANRCAVVAPIRAEIATSSEPDPGEAKG